MIKDIKIKNYKGFKDFQLDNLKQINLITGKNNTGKSTLLEAISLLYNPKSVYFINFSGFNSNNCYSFFHNLNTQDPIIISTSHNNLKLNIHLCENIKEEQRFIKDEKPENITKKETGFRFLYSSKNKAKTDLFINTNGNYYQTNKSDKIHISDTKLINLRNTYLDNYVKQFDEIQTNKQDDILIKLLKETIAPRLNNITLSQDNTLKVDLGLDKYLPFSALGDGIKTLFKILTTIYTTKDGIILIDEIENGFHYSVMNSVWKVILKAAKEFGVQIFATTHSKECIENYLKAFNELELEDDFDNYYRLEAKQDEIISVEYTTDELKNALQNNFEIR